MGLDIGIESTGKFKLLACIEKEKSFRETIELNLALGNIGNPDLKIYGDINEVDPWELLDELNLKPGELDVIIGGPPCQAFSTAGNRKSVEDPRGTLLWKYLDFIEVFKPKTFLMENVRGLVSASLRHRPRNQRPEKGGAPLELDEKPGSVLRAFARDLNKQTGEASNYRVDAFEVNSVNYGSPQIRERLICIGNRLNKVADFPQPTHGNCLNTEIADLRPLDQQLGLFDTDSNHNRSDEEVYLQPWRTLRDVIGDLNEKNPILLDFSPRKKYFLSLVPPGNNWRSLPEEIQRESMGKAFYAKGGRSGWWRRLTFDLPSPTLVTMPNHASTSLCHPEETRALSLKEYARIQEFPDYWQFAGTKSQKYCQIGNAVPVRLGEVAAKVLLDLLCSTGKYSTESAGEDLFRLVYVQSHIRTRKWFANGKAIEWNQDLDSKEAVYSSPKTKLKVRSVNHTKAA